TQNTHAPSPEARATLQTRRARLRERYESSLEGARLARQFGGGTPPLRLRRAEHQTLSSEGFPGAQDAQRVPDHRTGGGNRRLAEIALKRLADRLGEPGAAADIEAVSLRIALECCAAEVVGELHVLIERDFLELRWPEHLGCDADNLDADAGEEIAERPI